MRKFLISLAGAAAVLGAGAASAQTYHNNWDHHDRGYSDRSHNDRGYYHDRGYQDRSSWWGHRHYDHGRYAYGRQICDWRYGERVCWYQR